MVHESLAQRLRVLRAQKGWTLVEAARHTGIGRDTLSDLERGRQHPVMPTLTKLAKGYGVPVEDLLEESVGAGKTEAPTPGPDASEPMHFDLVIAMDMTEFAQYIATLDDDTVQGLREQLDAEAARRRSTDVKALQRLAVRSFIAGLDLQVRKEQVTREQLTEIAATIS